MLRPVRPTGDVVPTILVADDNSNIQKMVSLALKDEGVQDHMRWATARRPSKRCANPRPISCWLIFYACSQRLRSLRIRKARSEALSHSCSLLAGAFDPFDEREAQRVGADAVLKKPFVPPDPLVNLVKTFARKIAAAQLVAVGVTDEFVSNKVVDNRPSATIAVAVPPAPKRAEMRRAESRRSCSTRAASGNAQRRSAQGSEQRQAPVVEDFPVAMGQPQPERDTRPAALDQLLASAATEAATETGNKGLGGFAAWPSLVTSDSNAGAPAGEEAPSHPKTEQYWPPKRNPFQHVNDQETLDLEPKLDTVSAVAPSEEQVPSPEAIELTAQTHLSAESPTAPMDEAAVTEANRSAALAPETTTATEFGENASPSRRPSPFDWLTVSSAAVEPRAAAQLLVKSRSCRHQRVRMLLIQRLLIPMARRSTSLSRFTPKRSSTSSIRRGPKSLQRPIT